MWNIKLCLGTDYDFGVPIEQQIRMFHAAGFEGFFTEWSPDSDISGWKKLADQIGIEYQSIHAPFGRAADMWRNDEKADIAVNELISCLKDCAENSVPIMIVHAFIGFNDHSPNEYGIQNFKKVAEAAKQLGVKIAVENTEGEEYLDALIKSFWNYKNIGFCWDTGHEMCYNHSKDLMKSYGDKIFCTHLNDNLGIKDYSGEITWKDDLHLLPFDGIADWKGIADRLNKYSYNDFLTFELCKKSKPDRHENDIYNNMPFELYLSEAYKRACRVAALKSK